jgi:hypothetical protein
VRRLLSRFPRPSSYFIRALLAERAGQGRNAWAVAAVCPRAKPGTPAPEHLGFAGEVPRLARRAESLARKGSKACPQGFELCARGKKLWAQGSEACAQGSEACAQGFELYVQGKKPCARGKKPCGRSSQPRSRAFGPGEAGWTGDDIYLAIERGLEAARVQLLCLSPAALGSDWVTLERSTVLFRDPANSGRRFIPLLLADCALPDALRRYKYVDFREDAEAAFEELLKICRVEVREPLPPTGERHGNAAPSEALGSAAVSGMSEPLSEFPAQSPRRVWRKSRMLGYQGVVSPSNLQR